MANYSAVVAKSQTLGAAAVDVVTLSGFGSMLRVINRSATATDTIWFTVGTVLQAPTDPTVAGDNCYACQPTAAGMTVRVPITATGLQGATNGIVVKLISATAPIYTVQFADSR